MANETCRQCGQVFFEPIIHPYFCSTDCFTKRTNQMCLYGFHEHLTLLPADGLIGYECDNCKMEIWNDEIVATGIELACNRILRVIETGERHGTSNLEKLEKCLNKVLDLTSKVKKLSSKGLE